MAGFVYNDTDTVVRTKEGLLRGFKAGGVYQFRGIKYADARRFEAPERVRSWEGIRDATIYGCICCGPDLPRKMPMDEIGMGHRFWAESEHCQYLNVWTSELSDCAKKPVMVWIHGGGYIDGSSIELEIFDGCSLVKAHDVVFVSLNHRLNVLGFLDVSDYGEKYKNSANAGLADIVMALEWVKDNIATFGGDPDNITIFGHSGGGGKVSALMQVPAAEGLFHKAIIMSGIIPDDNMLVETDVPNKELVLEIMKELGLDANTPDDTDREFEKLLRCPEIPLERAVRRACRKIVARGGKVGWGPKKNYWYMGFVADNPVTEFSKKIPVMNGNGITEFGMPDGLKNRRSMTKEQREAYVCGLLGKEKGQRLLKEFRKAYPGVNEVYAPAYDTFFRWDTLRYLKAKSAASSAPVYSYIVALESDFLGGTIACHGTELPYAFHNTAMVPSTQTGGGRVTKRLERQISGAFAAFARTGDPNVPELPYWPPCKDGHITNMVFDRKCAVYTDNEQALQECIREVIPATVIDFFGPETEPERWLY